MVRDGCADSRHPSLADRTLSGSGSQVRELHLLAVIGLEPAED